MPLSYYRRKDPAHVVTFNTYAEQGVSSVWWASDGLGACALKKINHHGCASTIVGPNLDARKMARKGM